MKKVLFVASVTKHIKCFHIPYLKFFKDSGYEVHVASRGSEVIPCCDKHFDLNFERSPFKIKNIEVYKKLKKIINEGNYEIIHCHTPVASVLTRLAAKRARRRGTKIIYTAHGFHFYKKAPLKNWMFYYPIEKFLARYTDKLITINEEDYAIAKKKFKAKKVYYTNGVGVDGKNFDFEISNNERDALRSNFTIGSLDFLIMYAAELNKNKNQMMLLKAMKEIILTNPNIKLILAGDGENKELYEKYINENLLQSNVFLLGYRTDIPKLLKISDLYVSTSKREGLPVNILEAMLCSVPVIATDNRGHRQIIEDGKNGYLVKVDDYSDLAQKIKNLYLDSRMKEYIKENTRQSVNKYLLENVMVDMKKIYKD